jgi:hypothetical protein
MNHWIARSSSLCVVGLVVCGLLAQTTDGDLQAVVDRFYPLERLHPATPGERYTCYGVLESTSTDGPSLVIAGYTDRSTGVIRVLRRGDRGTFDVVAENPDAWVLSGTDCDVRLQDLDFDGRQEAIVYFLGVRASTGWILKWDGGKLVSLTPTTSSAGRDSSLLLSPTVYDLDHQSSLRVVAPKAIEQMGPGQMARNPAFVYRLGPSRYEMEKGILAIMGFRADVDPRGNERAFRLIQDSVPPWVLRVVNGDRSGGHRVTGATIDINDQQVLGPSALSARTEFVTKVLSSLTTVNHLTATLTGPDEAFITVLVEDSTKR